MVYSTEVKNMCVVHQGVHHGAAPIPEEAKWVKSREVKDISGYTHGVGWCAPQQGACKLSLNIKEGVIQEALIETIGCSGMTHSAAMACEILPGLTVLEALNTDLVCDAINTAMRELFLQIAYGRSQSAFSEDGLQIGAGLEDLGKGTRSMIGTTYGTLAKGPRYLELTDGYITELGLDENDEIIATIPIGYADGFIRANTGRCVWIDGQFAQVCGNVCMDQIMVRLEKDVPVGTPVEIFGPHIHLEQMAEELHTIPYEIICLISGRVTRIYRWHNEEELTEENARLIKSEVNFL